MGGGKSMLLSVRLTRSFGVVPTRGSVLLAGGVRRLCVSATQQRGRKRASPLTENGKGEVVVITSGKGGVGKTTSAASFGAGLAKKGFRTCLIDFDIGLRNLDIHLGMERRVVYDFVNCILGE